MSKKILVFTDSLGLPRNFPEMCSYESTWPFLLKQHGFELHQVSIGGATVEELYRQVNYHYLFDPDIVLIQSGIVDCAPRALTKFENLFFNKFYLSRVALKYFLPKLTNFLRKYRGITYTNVENYERNIIKFKKYFSKLDIYWLSIVPPEKEYEEKVPGIKNNITKYNLVIKKHFKNNFISIGSIENGVMSDHIHLNEKGHKQVFDLIMKKIF